MLDLSADARERSLRHLAELIGQTAALAETLGQDDTALALRSVLDSFRADVATRPAAS